jgi:hypothetical protein
LYQTTVLLPQHASGRSFCCPIPFLLFDPCSDSSSNPFPCYVLLTFGIRDNDPGRELVDLSPLLRFPSILFFGWFGERDSSWPNPSPERRLGTVHIGFLEFLQREVKFQLGEQPLDECLQPVR